MIETPIVFGTDQHLVGVLSLPKRDVLKTSLPVVLLSNVGLNHRVGPFRMWVDLARQLAEQGIASLRFDSSGLGDSRQRLGSLDDRSRAVLDMKEAISTAIQKSGCRSATVIALCSGTDAAHDVAVADSRVSRAAFIDGYAYRTRGFYFHHWLNRAKQTRRWRLFLRRRFPALLGEQQSAPLEGVEIFTREYPTLPQFRQDVGAMLSRGCKVSYVYTGEVDYQLNHREQFWAMFDTDYRQQIIYEYLPTADHVFSNRAQRALLFKHLLEFCCTPP